MVNFDAKVIHRRQFLSAAAGALAAACGATGAIPASTFQFKPGELDFHFHAGLEREQSLSVNAWLDKAVATGRRCFLMIDHLELYRPEPYKKYIKHPRYPTGMPGYREFLKEVDLVRKRRDVLIFSGWEVIEGEIESGLDLEAMGLVEAIGWHIGHHDGHQLVRRIKKVREVQSQLQVPMILYHPFSKVGPRPETSVGRSVAELRCLSGEVQKEMIDLLRNSSIYLEINVSWVFGYKWEDPKMRAALTEDILPLAEAGLSFTVGSDDHRLEDMRIAYRPEMLCTQFGISPRQLNGIVGDLLSQRAIGGLSGAPPQQKAGEK